MSYLNCCRLFLCALSLFTCWGVSEALSHAQEEELTYQWMKMHTKACPNCGIPIEKNGGCDWMKCRVCAYEFCWECLAPHDHNLATHQHRKRSGQ